MNYWEIRSIIKDLIPRRSKLEDLEKHLGLVKEKGRKINYTQFNLDTGQMEVHQRLLNKDEINSFLEVSLRAAHCPMPLNSDTYDAVRCPYGCRYCFADSFRASLYTSFFDNSKNLGMRTCNPSFFRSEMDKLMKHRGTRAKGSELQRAIAIQIPIRLGIRFEDFLPIENRKRVSYDFLSYLKDESYPIMVNTKSSLIGNEDYVRVLADNEGGSAVHITVISSDDNLNKLLEPAAPPFMERITAAKFLSEAGVRVVARIEPFMIFINDDRGKVDDWISAVKWAGVNHVTLDTYSWSATSPGIKRQMEMEGVDFERMFLLMSDSQWLGSLLLSKFIEYLRENGLSCSTFDFGCSSSNSQNVCCECEDIFENFSYGNNIMAIRFICKQNGNPTTWEMFEEHVEENGGWLGEGIRKIVFDSWNLSGNLAYSVDWAQGIVPYGVDKCGRKIWAFKKEEDFREELLEGLIRTQ